MTVAPELEPLLLEERLHPSPSVADVPVAQSRALASTAFAALVGEPQQVHSVTNRFINGPTADLPIRIYRPVAGNGLGCVVYFHGSGWVLHNIDTSDCTARAVANAAQCVVVAVNYQKAPEHPYPVPLDDALAGTSWVVDHAAELGINPRRVGVMGDSAGGNLAASVCRRARSAGGPFVRLQVLIYPAVEFDSPTASAEEFAEGYSLTTRAMRWFWRQYAPDAEDATDPLVSPILAEDLAGQPPALIVTAEFDPLRDEGEAYARKLEGAGVPVVLHRYPGMIHGFFWMLGISPAATRLVDEIAAYVREVFSSPDF